LNTKHTHGSLPSISETLTLQAALPQVAFKKSKCLDVYCFITHHTMKT
jgi:hypothetical protein